MNINDIDTKNKVFIIAEIGNNHEGNFEIAKKMIIKAAESGADAVKFQTFVPENISSGDHSRLKRLNKFKFSFEQFEKLALIARENNIIFFSTPFDIESAKFLNKIQPLFKIASGDNNFYPLIKVVKSFGKPVILSTGCADLENIKKIYSEIKKFDDKNTDTNYLNFAFLHCVSSYPVPVDQANLASIIHLRKHFPNIEIGYSDHTLGIEAAVSSVFAGARIIEKHFTLDKNFSDFRDHNLSADPVDMKNLVQKVREAEKLFGTDNKEIQLCEKEMLTLGRRSIASAYDLPSGTILKYSDFTWIRPGIGFAPGEEQKLIGKKTKKDLKIWQIIKHEDFD